MSIGIVHAGLLTVHSEDPQSRDAAEAVARDITVGAPEVKDVDRLFSFQSVKGIADGGHIGVAGVFGLDLQAGVLAVGRGIVTGMGLAVRDVLPSRRRACSFRRIFGTAEDVFHKFHHAACLVSVTGERLQVAQGNGTVAPENGGGEVGHDHPVFLVAGQDLLVKRTPFVLDPAGGDMLDARPDQYQHLRFVQCLFDGVFIGSFPEFHQRDVAEKGGDPRFHKSAVKAGGDVAFL